MEFTYRTKGVCAQQIKFDLDDNKVTNVEFYGGCNGNLKAISKLVDGMSVDELLYEFAHTDELYFDMEQMTQAIDSPSVEVPKTALKDLASFERFLKESFA